MKRILLILALVTVGFLYSYSQSATMTAEELKFRNGIEQYLKEEGYVPTIDNDDNSLNFKKEGERYWLTVTGSSPTYIELHKAGFGIEDTNRSYLIEACNKACRETRCAKAYVTQTSVSFTVETYYYYLDDFKKIFNRSINALDTAKDKAKKYYNEFDN